MLKGKLVLLRPVRRSDLQNFLKWFNDPEVTRYLDRSLPLTEMEEEKNVEELGTTRARTDAAFVIEASEHPAQSIGWIDLTGINPKDHNAMFGIVIGEKECWGKGYGMEAARLLVNYGFEQLNLHRISSRVHALNERSLKLHNRVGFKEEGRQREAIFKNGIFHDYVMFGVLREEWKGLTQ